MSSKRICVRFDDKAAEDLDYLLYNGGGWDPSIIIRKAVKLFAAKRREELAAERKRETDFLAGKMNGNGKAKPKRVAKGPKRHTV